MVDIVVNGSIFNVEKRGRSNGEIELVVNGKPVIVDRVSSFAADSSTQLFRIGQRLLLCKVAGQLNEHSIVTWINDKRLLVELSTGQEADSRERASLVNTGPISVEALGVYERFLVCDRFVVHDIRNGCLYFFHVERVGDVGHLKNQIRDMFW